MFTKIKENAIKIIGNSSVYKNIYLNKLRDLTYSLILYKIRKLDKEFFRFLNLLRENEKKSYDKIREYQFSRFKSLLNNAYNFTEFYKQKFESFGFNPKNLKSFKDIEEIPYLTKEEIRRFSNKMVLSNYKGKIYLGHTSGTTGKPLELFYDEKTISREWASIYYIWEKIGYKLTDGRVEFRGFIENSDDFIFDPYERILRINIIKMSEKNIKLLIDKIKSVGYKFFMGYPSAIYKFTQILERKNIEIIPKGIMLASEVIYDWQVEKIEKLFPKSRIIAHYGQAERIALGFWGKNRNYEFIPTYGFLEVIKNSNELVATGFINELMPIIRYKLNDNIDGFQQMPTKPSCTLFPVIKTIFGREEDVTYNSNGDQIPPAVVTFPFKKLKHFQACKIIQNSLSNFDLIIEAKKNEKTLNEAKNLISDLKKIYGRQINMNLQFVNKIPVDNSGKFRWIECKIKNH